MSNEIIDVYFVTHMNKRIDRLLQLQLPHMFWTKFFLSKYSIWMEISDILKMEVL